MTFISLDYDAVCDVVTTAKDYADDLDAAATALRATNANQGYASALTGLSTVSEDTAGIREKADEIQTRADLAKHQSETGQTFTGEDGTYHYYLPDGAEDTVTNVQAAANALDDADAVRGAGGGELEDVLATEVAPHQHDEVYAAAFADRMGPQGMLDLSNQVQSSWDTWKMNPVTYDPKHPDRQPDEIYTAAEDRYQTSLATLSTLMGTASSSTAWTDEHRTQYAHDLAALVNDPTAPPTNPLGFNLLMSGADRSAANVTAVGSSTIQSGGEFDTDFLLTLAQDLKAHEDQAGGWQRSGWWDQYMKLGSNPSYNTDGLGAWDPATGLLTAMGRNPQASLDFLAPPKDGDPTAVSPDNLDWVMNRHSNPVMTEAMTSAFAGASELRVPADDQTDERAAWLTEQAALRLTSNDEDSYKPGWTPTARQNMATMLANSMVDVDAAARGTTPDGQTAFLSAQPAAWNRVQTSAVRTLLQEVGTDDVALATLGESAGRYGATRQSLGAAPGATQGDIESDATANARLNGFILGAAQKGRDLDAQETDAGINAFFTALDRGLGFVPSPAGATASTAVSITKSYLLDWAKDAALAGGGADTTVEEAGAQSRVAIEAHAANAMAKAGLIGEEATRQHDGTPYGYDWLNPDGTVNVDLLVNGKDGESAEDREARVSEFHGWLDDPEIQSMDSTDEDIFDAYDQGVGRGRGEAPEKNG